MKKESGFGTEPYKLHKKDSPSTSVEAAYAVDSTKLESMVYDAVVGFGKLGCISDEVRAQYPNYPYSSITARYAALERKGKIFYKGDKRKGESGRNQRVIRSYKFKIKQLKLNLSGFEK